MIMMQAGHHGTHHGQASALHPGRQGAHLGDPASLTKAKRDGGSSRRSVCADHCADHADHCADAGHRLRSADGAGRWPARRPPPR